MRFIMHLVFVFNHLLWFFIKIKLLQHMELHLNVFTILCLFRKVTMLRKIPPYSILYTFFSI